MKHNEEITLLDKLYYKPSDYRYNQEESNLIKKYYPKSNFLIYYAFYRGKSRYNAYIVFIIDKMPQHPRRSGVENKWEKICSRPISNDEYEEFIANFGCKHWGTRRFRLFYYKDIQFLQNEDMKYGIETPEIFVKECIKRGYSKRISNGTKL